MCPSTQKGGTGSLVTIGTETIWFLFCDVGVPGRTGDDYDNEFVGTDLRWFGKHQSTLRHRSILSMLQPPHGSYVYIFVRKDHLGPFVFKGLGAPITTKDTMPVEILWRLSAPV